MRKLSKIIIMLIILVIAFQNFASIANVVNLGEIKYIEKGDLGFYSIQFWYEAKQKWEYVTYSRTYYTDDNGEKRIAYCTSPNLDGVGWLPGEYDGYDTTVQEKLANEQLWRIFKNGYPYATPEELGVETEDDAYLATKQAAYSILKGRSLDQIKTYFRAGQTEINGENLQDIQRRGQKVIDAIYKLVDIGYNGKDTMTNPQIKKVGELELDKNDSNYYIQKYTLENAGIKTTIKIDKLDISKSIVTNNSNDITIVGEDDKSKSEIKNGESFYLKISKDSIKSDGNIVINYSISYKDYPIYYAKSKIENTQDYLMTAEKIDIEKDKIQLDIDGHKSSLKIIKKDSETGKTISDVTYNIKYLSEENIGDYITDKNGEINIDKLLPEKILITEIKTPDNYVLNTETKEVNLKYNELYIMNLENKSKEGKIKIIKTSSDDNNITHTTSGTKIEGATFGIYDLNENKIAEVRTDKDGIALTDNLKIGKYTVKELDSTKWYLLNKRIFDVEITEDGQIIELNIQNESANPKVDIEKDGPEITIPDKEISYSFNIQNTGNVSLTDFSWYDFLPYEKCKITKINTGTYNQDINYSIYYKTNKKSDYTLLADNLNSKVDNNIDLSNVYLEKDEVISEIKVKFGKVDVGFKSENTPYIYLKTNTDIDDNDTIVNDTVIEGYYNNYKVSDESTINTIVENKHETIKKLPRTGF